MAHKLLAERPNPDDWVKRPVFFIDETYVRNTKTGIKWVTIHDFEDPESFDIVRKRGDGRMFSGGIFGPLKGPSHCWDKKEGKITAERYIQRSLSAYRAFLLQQARADYPNPLFQHDNAPAHTARITRAWLQAAGIEVIDWAPYSPDLNPIENVWAIMKLWIDNHYDVEGLSQQGIEEAVFAAWDAVGEDELIKIARSMPGRLREVIAKNGGKTDH